MNGAGNKWPNAAAEKSDFTEASRIPSMVLVVVDTVLSSSIDAAGRGRLEWCTV
jgi:hypothetical protein